MMYGYDSYPSKTHGSTHVTRIYTVGLIHVVSEHSRVALHKQNNSCMHVIYMHEIELFRCMYGVYSDACTVSMHVR